MRIQGSFPPTALWRSARRSPRFWWRLIHGRWRIIRRKIPYWFLLRIIKMSISIVDLDRVLNRFAMSVWGTFEELTFWSFVVHIFCFSWRIEVLTEVEAACEELDVLCDGVGIFSFGLTVSRVGFFVFSNQVNIVCVSTELKTRLATRACDFCTGESFVAETNLRASGYAICFSDFTFWISFFSQMKCWQSLDEAMWGWPQLEHLKLTVSIHQNNAY